MLTPKLSGRAWVFGDSVNTDVILPGRRLATSATVAELAPFVMEGIRPEFAGRVTPGDLVVAGDAFGIGSSREAAAGALKAVGVAAIVAQSIAPIFFRNCVNIGLPALTCVSSAAITEGAHIEVDVVRGIVTVPSTGQEFATRLLPPVVLEILATGGLEERLARSASVEP